MNVYAAPSLHSEARRIESRLESEHVGYGSAFTDLLQEAVSSIISTPRLFSITEDGPHDEEVREYFIARFKYRLIYTIEENDLVFIALAHAHQLPGKWIRRWNEERHQYGQPDSGSE